MSEEIIKLKPEECCKSLVEFYRMVAEKSGVTVTKDTCYDCKKIIVTPAVQTELIRFMWQQKLGVQAASTLLIQYGPKATLQGKKDECAALCEEGFVTHGEAV